MKKQPDRPLDSIPFLGYPPPRKVAWRPARRILATRGRNRETSQCPLQLGEKIMIAVYSLNDIMVALGENVDTGK